MLVPSPVWCWWHRPGDYYPILLLVLLLLLLLLLHVLTYRREKHWRGSKPGTNTSVRQTSTKRRSTSRSVAIPNFACMSPSSGLTGPPSVAPPSTNLGLIISGNVGALRFSVCIVPPPVIKQLGKILWLKCTKFDVVLWNSTSDSIGTIADSLGFTF